MHTKIIETNQAPTTKQWVTRVNNVKLTEDLTSSVRGMETINEKTRRPCRPKVYTVYMISLHLNR